MDSTTSNEEIQAIVNDVDLLDPLVPTTPRDIEKFEKDINEFMSDVTDQRKKEEKESLSY